ncbi:unnamed protein product [Danaus chrysippus]|uniref:(African queen) hypothetical protein n=1 Tax=Danaus chrysippus TaxID=151541 RepID=A0A8J2WAK3_9NEOP|nr:unnamed protein product [Danaus chrysippus]
MLQDDNLDRGAHSDRGGVWFGPRLGKRSLQLVDESNSQTFLRLLEAAEALKYYYDQMSYQMQADAPQKVIKKVIFTPKLGRALDQYSEKMIENIEFTPRLGRKLPERTPTTPSDEESIQDTIAANRRPSYFSPRLGRNYNFSPRLGRELYGYFFIFIKLINSYLLIAANLNDFRTIAEKLVPQNFAHKLVKMVTHQDFVKSEASYDNSGYDESDTSSVGQPYLKGKDYQPKKVYNIQETKVDFDELVERVKKRLEEELKNKYLKHKQQNEERDRDIKERDVTQNGVNIKIVDFNKQTSEQPKKDTIVDENAYEDLEYEDITEKQEKQDAEPKIIKLTTQATEYADAMEEVADRIKLSHKSRIATKKTEQDYEIVTQSDLFNKIDLIKQDSYEDYKIPNKKNIYASEETTKAEIQTENYEGNKRFKVQQNRQITRRVKFGEMKYNSQEIKKTDEENDTIILSENKDRTRKVKKGTMIPKRELYTIVTPNYIERIPNVVEKYNFDEPLPAKDREREEIRYYGNPPASINKKVRLL